MALPLIIADFETQLSTAIAIGGVTFDLSSVTDDDGNTIPAGTYCFTVDNGSSKKEYFFGTLSGSTVSSIQSVSRQGVKTSGAVRAHRVGASVMITDFITLRTVARMLAGDEALDGSSPLIYDNAPILSDGKELATVAYVLSVVNGGTVNFSSQTINATAGETLSGATLPVWCYFKEADQCWWKVDTDDSTTYENVSLGFAISTATAGNGVTIQLSGICSGFSGLTLGSKYYGHGTAGTISTTVSGSFIGWAFSATQILMLPKGLNVPTYNEKNAMAGTNGVPSADNKFVTGSNTSDGGADQSQTTQNATSAVGEASTAGLRNRLAQSFIPTYTKIRGVSLYKTADTGTFTGTVTVSLQADTAGSPSGSALATVTLTNAQWEGFAVGECEIIFASEYASMVQGATYWIVIETSTADTSNHPNVGTNSAGGYGNGGVKLYNATDTWVAVATIDLYFKTLTGTASQVVETNSSGKIESNFYSLSEMPVPAFLQEQSIEPFFQVSGIEPVVGGSNDGSALFTYFVAGTGALNRYQRDALTGQYYLSHSTSPTWTPNNSGTGGIIVIGIYMYAFASDSTNIVCSRFLAADLTGEQVMTVPTVACTANPSVWTDGTYAYLVSNSSSTTSRKWSVSGTVFTAVSTTSCSNTISGSAVCFDGVLPYCINYNGNPTTFILRKFSDIHGTSVTNTTYQSAFVPSLMSWTVGIVSIDTQRFYYLAIYNTYDETNENGTRLVMIPLSKT